MAWKNLQQTTLVDAMLIEHEALKELDDVHELINWSRIESLLAELHSSRRGEKAWPPLLMFKALLLQSWYALSDPALEKQLARDLLFRRFIGLSISESVPDHSTLWRFRQLLEKQNLMTTLLNAINDQLAEQGLYIKAGEVSIIDASVIEAKQCRPHKREDGSSTQDPDAAWNVKAASDGKRKSTYGYKAHINVDEEGLIKTLAYTAGNVHDSNHFTTLLKGNESAAYADSAYQSEMHTDWLTRARH
jgi:IS5 family transposase